MDLYPHSAAILYRHQVPLAEVADIGGVHRRFGLLVAVRFDLKTCVVALELAFAAMICFRYSRLIH